jgi:TonB family protein
MKHIFLSAALLFGLLVGSSDAQDPSKTQIKGGILNGKAISLPKPAYPIEAKAAGVQGIVYVNVDVDESGAVVSAAASTTTHKVVRSKGEQTVEVEIPPADPILGQAAERAALEARFAPTLLNGQPVRIAGTIIYNFVAEHSSNEELGNTDLDVLNDKALNLPNPVYPAAARAVKAEGTVTVKVVVDEGGQVISATAISGHPLLRAAAVQAARSATFSPTVADGRPVKVTGHLTYNFVGAKSADN